MGHVPSRETEIVSRRAWNSRTFATARGYRTEIYASPINYRDASGKWQPIDDTLVGSSSGNLRNRANVYHASLPSSLAQPVTFSLGADSVSFVLAAATGRRSVSGAGATYAAALPNLDVNLVAESQALKENLVLTARSAPTSFSYNLRLSNGLSAVANANGGVDILGRDGVALEMPAPFMYDSARPAAVSRTVSLRLANHAGRETLTLTPDRSWLGSPQRVYPVTIDPTLSVPILYYGGRDCFIQNTTPSTSYCSSADYTGTTDYVGYDGTNIDRSLFMINVEKGGGFTNYVPNSNILDAHLDLNLSSSTSSSAVAVSMAPIQQAWSGYTAGHDVTWNTTNGSTSWTPGGNIGAVLDTENVGPAAGAYHWKNLTQTVQSWVNGSASDYGLLLKVANESAVGMLQFNNHNATSNQPHLTVEWNNWNGLQSFFKLERHKLNDRMDLAVNLANGNVILHANDLNMKGTGVDLHLDRYYNSLSGERAHLGQGWTQTLGCDVKVEPNDYDGISYEEGDGYAVLLRSDGHGGWTAPGVDATLTQSGSNYTLTFHANGTKFNFGSGGCLQSVVDKYGNTMSMSYINEDVQSITDTQSRLTQFSYVTINGNDQLDHVTDPSGRVYQFGYDSNANVNKYTDPMQGVTTFGYNANQQVNQITDPKQNMTNITYSTTYPYPVTQISFQNSGCAGGACTLGFAYNTGAGSCTNTDGTIVTNTVETDGDGNQTTYCFDKNGLVKQVVDAKGQHASTTYSPDNQVQTYTDAANPSNPTSFAYDATTNNLTSATQPTGANNVWSYNQGSAHTYFPDSVTDTQGNTFNYSYDSSTSTYPSLTQVQQGTSGPKWQASYNSNGTVKTNTDANNNVTSYTYFSSTDPNLGQRNQLQTITYAAGSNLTATQFTYDSLGRVATKTDANGTQTYGYDALDRILQILYGGATTCTPLTGNCIQYTYDANGNVSQLSDNTGATTLNYDAMNRQTSKVLPGTGGTITYSYDNQSNLSSLQDSGGTVNYAYDAVNELKSLTEPNGKVTSFTYDSAYHRTTAGYPNGVTECMEYDHSERLAQIIAFKSGSSCPAPAFSGGVYQAIAHNSTTQLNNYYYSYANPNKSNADSDERWSGDVNGSLFNYGYDALNRLTSASGSAGSYSFGYDNNGNLTNNNGVTQSFNSGNELTSAGTTTYGYDGNGNEVSANSGWSFGYNSKNQTSSVTAPGQTALSMSYTGASESERTTAGASSYTYNVLGCGGSTGTSGSTSWTRDNKGVLSEERIGPSVSYTAYYYLFDGLGSVVALTDSTGAVQNTYSYSPYGKILSKSENVANPWQFAGGYLDSQTGLIKFGMRYYDANLGRWTQEDSQPGPNLYAYAGDDPATKVDPSGAFPDQYEWDQWIGPAWNSLETYGFSFGVGCALFVAGTAGAVATNPVLVPWLAAATSLSEGTVAGLGLAGVCLAGGIVGITYQPTRF